MPRIVKKHPLAIRWFHWINFPVLALMVWSGTLILWANDVYATELYQVGFRLTHGGMESENPPKWLRVPDHIVVAPSIRVVYGGDKLPADFPAEDKRTEMTIGSRLSEGMAWHFALAWLFTLNGLAYILFLALSGQWRHLIPKKESFAAAMTLAVKELAFWKHAVVGGEGGEKYNHAQRIAYSGVAVLGGLMLVTGLAIYKPAQVAWLAIPFGGYQGARLVHFIVTCLFVAFFFVHVSQVMRAGWNNFRAIITGWEIMASPLAPSPSPAPLPEEIGEPSAPEETLEEHQETKIP